MVLLVYVMIHRIKAMFRDVDIKIQVQMYLNFEVNNFKYVFLPMEHHTKIFIQRRISVEFQLPEILIRKRIITLDN